MKRLVGLAMLFALFAVAACRTAPIENVESMPLNAPANVTLDEVKDGIIRAGELMNWQMTEVDPGHIEAEVNVRGKHRAMVDIFFDTRVFSIKYRDSVNLNHDVSRALIHPNYNNWVSNLAVDIQDEVRLSATSPAGVAEGAPGAEPVDATAEAEAWDAIRNSRNPDDYRAFLAAYPNGTFSALAESRAAVPEDRVWSPVFAGPVPRDQKRRVEAFFRGQERTARVEVERYNTRNNVFAPNQSGTKIAVIEGIDVLAADQDGAVVKLTYIAGSRIWGTLDSNIYEMKWEGSTLRPKRHQRP